MIETVIKVLSVIFLVPAALISAYYALLAVVAMAARPRKNASQAGALNSFAIVIPAHNEEDAIGDTLRSCLALDYPEDKYMVYCIADNCTDSTASVARQMGAVSLERHDLNNRGKGYALEWAFERILPKGHDAVMVLDADCTIEKSALRIFDRHLKGGADVLQASYVTSNPDESPISYISAVGNLMENRLLSVPKSALGLAVFLRGTGMVFKSRVLEAVRWSAHSIVEDVEYGITLLKKGFQIRFVGEAVVYSPFPTTPEQLKVQRERWAKGNLRFGRANALRLVFEGLLKGSPALADAGWTFIALSRPLAILCVLASLALSAVSVYLFGGSFSYLILKASFVVSALLAAYFALAVVLQGVSLKRLYLLLKTPAVVARLAAHSLTGLFSTGQSAWIRTPRA